MDVCHEVDDGTGEIHVCHEYAHENDDASCISEGARCIDLCEAAAADGGETDAATDGATDDHDEG